MNKKKIIILLVLVALVAYIFLSQSSTTTPTQSKDSDSNGIYSDAISKLNNIQSQLNAQKKDVENKLLTEEFEARKNMPYMIEIASVLISDIYNGGKVVDDGIRIVREISNGALKVVAEEFQKMAPGRSSLRNASLWKIIISPYKNYPLSRLKENYYQYLPNRLASLELF